MALPLAGYRVLELAHLIAGPVCGMYLADMGAEVVKLTTFDTPIRFSRTPGGIRTHAPALGEDTDAVLRAAGVEAGEIARLRSLGALR